MKRWLVVAGILVVAGLIISTVCLTVVGFDFSKLGTSVMVTNTYTTEEAFTNIRLDAITADIIFVPSEDGGVKVVCYENEKIPYSVYVEGDSLVITCKDNRKWYDHIGFNWETNTVTVYLPAGEYGDLQLKCTTGDVTMPQDFHFAKANVKVTTGDVLWKANVDENLTIHSTTGDTTLAGMTCGTLDVKATTGDVTLDHMDAAKLDIKVTTGDVEGTLLSSKKFEVKVTTGKVDVPKTTEGGTCRVKATTGNVKLKIAQ